MKSSTIWVIVGIAVVILIVYAVSKSMKSSNMIVNSNGSKMAYPPSGTGAWCSPDSYICGITSGGTPICCPIPPSVERKRYIDVENVIKSAEQLYCERHGGTWNGTGCTAFTDSTDRTTCQEGFEWVKLNGEFQCVKVNPRYVGPNLSSISVSGGSNGNPAGANG